MVSRHVRELCTKHLETVNSHHMASNKHIQWLVLNKFPAKSLFSSETALILRHFSLLPSDKGKLLKVALWQLIEGENV